MSDELKKAVELDTANCGLQVNVGRDGVWMIFTAKDGKSFCMNMDVYAAQERGSFGWTVQSWCNDRREDANNWLRDNGQFGVGA